MQYETNSKLIKPNDIFIAIKGQHYDGHNFIEEAIKNKASKIIGEDDIKNIKIYKKVKNTKKYLTKVISKENKKLTKNFKIIGITGTKGKSTTAMILYQMLKLLNVNCAYIGTLGLHYKDVKMSLNNTTPDILSLNKILQKLKEENITHIIMEVSSHALCENRIKGLRFYSAAFTNLSQDHLDYHKDMQNYLKAKLKILRYLDGKIILNNDDPAASSFKKKTSKNITIGQDGDYKLDSFRLYPTGTIINFEYQYSKYTVAIPLIGRYNIYNYLTALALCNNLGYSLLDIINLTNSLKGIVGRNELIKSDKGYAIIDYAHSPKSVEETLLAYRELKIGKMITIIGCGGNRDKTKRPIMGKLATKYSDYVIFTSDNPRDEDPKEILKDITKDLTDNNYEVIEDRRAAIKKGVKLLKKNDYLLILGKGHENYQLIKNVKYHFDDKEEVLKYLH
ncbi:MAG: UDP-N-acetylmuramoyl-L-alanyl-D-glutamate--2,6-diaminopimelate ligase [Firmicutes bacterium]|nr:UDP-N-acetylmuramoyl-L-alanyl-D-glutamate--2,6-diaminopimelate ligase [Bacillota bacterium]